MIDIETMDRDALIAEIRRLRERVEYRQCPCGGNPKLRLTHGGKFFIGCLDCKCRARTADTPKEAWAAWDGVE